MKRFGNLWPEITSLKNLFSAAQKAQKGKRFRENVLLFNYRREDELVELRESLSNKNYYPRPYRTFEIVEPKRRLISAASYRDRVVHHALCNVIEPIFDRTFIHDSYATRRGKGTHKALKRFVKWVRSNRWILQCDIRKYFPTIDHEFLKRLIRRKIKCPDTLWLIDLIIDHSNEQEATNFYFEGDDLLISITRRKGLPIGNLTSQFFANVYLDGFDHWVKEKLGIRHYVRYMDDFALFSDDRDELLSARPKIEEFLAGLRLKIHPIKSQLFECKKGANFLGFRILPDRVRVRMDNLRRARRRLRRQAEGYRRGELDFFDVYKSIQSWIAHLEHANTFRLRERLFSRLVFSRG